jgi:diguanylate cyclase (GGDEF)-like protein
MVHQCQRPRFWQPSEMRLLHQLATQVSIAIQQAELHRELEQANQRLQRLAFLDGLTQVANRRRFEEYLDQEWRRLGRDNQPLSLILCDIDSFKVYNDTYGHQAGDDCLRRVADALQQVVKRPADLVTRYGGEEFAIILPNTDMRGAISVAESLCQTIRELNIPHIRSAVKPYVTLSCGVASLIPSSSTTPEQLIKHVDDALYDAKGMGRNRVVWSHSEH